MSFGSEIRQRGYAQLVEFDGQALTILNDAGGTVWGILAINPYIDPPFALASDTREKACLELIREYNQDAIANINLNDQLQDCAGNLWQVIMREDNPADFSTRYWLAKFIEGTDT